MNLSPLIILILYYSRQGATCHLRNGGGPLETVLEPRLRGYDGVKCRIRLNQGALPASESILQPAACTGDTGGGPYGASHWAGVDGAKQISPDEKILAVAPGRRLAETANKLHGR